MKKTIALSTLLLVGILVLGGCSLYNVPTTENPALAPTPEPTPASAKDTTPTPAPATVKSSAVNIQNFAFLPSSLTIKKGTTVTWTNNDTAPHQIKSSTFNSDLMSKEQSFSFTFNTAGTFDYICSLHPSMTGKIIVE